MILGITGHRPKDLGGFDIPNPIYNYVCQELENNFIKLNPDKIITGMALGTDLYAASIANKLNIPYIAAVPFTGQENKWTDKYKKIYYNLLQKAEKVIIVSGGSYHVDKMMIRNTWIVDNSDMMLAVYKNGKKGGTANCIGEALYKNKKIIYINPDAWQYKR